MAQAVTTTRIADQLPAHLQGYAGQTGMENIETGDATIPRIKIGQGLSAEVKDKLVDDGDLFINLGAQVVAKRGQELLFVPLAYAKEFILWRPREDQGGGILARARPVRVGGITRYGWDKPDETFRVKVKGVVPAEWQTGAYIDEDGLDKWGSEIPGQADSGIAATAHFNYVVALPGLDNLIAAFSFSRTTAKAAKDLNGMLKQTMRVPMFGRVFAASTYEEKNDKGEFNKIKISPAGFANEEAFAQYSAIATPFLNAGFVVDQSDEEADGAAAGKTKDEGFR